MFFFLLLSWAQNIIPLKISNFEWGHKVTHAAGTHKIQSNDTIVDDAQKIAQPVLMVLNRNIYVAKYIVRINHRKLLGFSIRAKNLLRSVLEQQRAMNVRMVAETHTGRMNVIERGREKEMLTEASDNQTTGNTRSESRTSFRQFRIFAWIVLRIINHRFAARTWILLILFCEFQTPELRRNGESNKRKALAIILEKCCSIRECIEWNASMKNFGLTLFRMTLKNKPHTDRNRESAWNMQLGGQSADGNY